MPFLIAGIVAVGAIFENISEEERREAQAYQQATQEYYQYYRQENTRLDQEYQNYMDRYYNGY